MRNRQNLRESPLSSAHRMFLRENAQAEYAAAAWAIPNEPFSDEAIESKIRDVNMDGTPGPGFTQYGTTNREVIERLGINKMVSLVREALKAYARGDRTLQDVRVFVKQEPTKKSKLNIDRQRLIWSFPLVDQIVCALVFDPSLEREIAKYDEIPTKVGMSTVGGDWDHVYRTFAAKADSRRKERLGDHKYLEADKSAWDWSVPAWAIELERDCRWDLCINPLSCPEFKEVFFTAYWRLLNCRVIFSDGESMKQLVPSTMKSGHKLTISSNSRMQYLIKNYCTVGWVNESLMAMGDDTIEDFTGDEKQYFAEWRKLGFVIADEDINVAATPPELTFCSQDSTIYCGRAISVLRNRLKTAFALRHCQYKLPGQFEQFVEQLRWNYCADPQMDAALSALIAVVNPRLWKPTIYYVNRVAGIELPPGHAPVLPGVKGSSSHDGKEN